MNGSHLEIFAYSLQFFGVRVHIFYHIPSTKNILWLLAYPKLRHIINTDNMKRTKQTNTFK